MIEPTGGHKPIYGNIPLESYTVGSWCPTPDGTGPATAVAIQFSIKDDDLEFLLRLGSRERVNQFIAALEYYRDDVWPQEEPE